VRTLQKNDIKRLSIFYPSNLAMNGVNNQMIDYVALSKDIGLHAPSLNLVMM